ncbi:hypothetical protein BDP27DRAFT_1416696 [Rhodocollybia butyracea]|uniref:Uncharacterized protein n=1 Tax=Rhodocollybia butyracea TaxID=206335 RepID=A0A9P5UBE1_9AGAR|nr:hypothetical protein BDP27DRAFT_1416696 [Rhodocollybia butyracea]
MDKLDNFDAVSELLKAETLRLIMRDLGEKGPSRREEMIELLKEKIFGSSSAYETEEEVSDKKTTRSSRAAASTARVTRNNAINGGKTTRDVLSAAGSVRSNHKRKVEEQEETDSSEMEEKKSAGPAKRTRITRSNVDADVQTESISSAPRRGGTSVSAAPISSRITRRSGANISAPAEIKKRGRPSKRSSSYEAEQGEGDEDEDEDVDEFPLKRTRTRSRKTHEDNDEQGVEEVETVSAKRGRGRPRKNQAIVDDEDEVQDASVARTPSPGRRTRTSVFASPGKGRPTTSFSRRSRISSYAPVSQSNSQVAPISTRSRTGHSPSKKNNYLTAPLVKRKYGSARNGGVRTSARVSTSLSSRGRPVGKTRSSLSKARSIVKPRPKKLSSAPKPRRRTSPPDDRDQGKKYAFDGVELTKRPQKRQENNIASSSTVNAEDGLSSGPGTSVDTSLFGGKLSEDEHGSEHAAGPSTQPISTANLTRPLSPAEQPVPQQQSGEEIRRASSSIRQSSTPSLAVSLTSRGSVIATFPLNPSPPPASQSKDLEEKDDDQIFGPEPDAQSHAEGEQPGGELSNVVEKGKEQGPSNDNPNGPSEIGTEDDKDENEIVAAASKSADVVESSVQVFSTATLQASDSEEIRDTEMAADEVVEAVTPSSGSPTSRSSEVRDTEMAADDEVFEALTPSSGSRSTEVRDTEMADDVVEAVTPSSGSPTSRSTPSLAVASADGEKGDDDESEDIDDDANIMDPSTGPVEINVQVVTESATEMITTFEADGDTDINEPSSSAVDQSESVPATDLFISQEGPSLPVEPTPLELTPFEPTPFEPTPFEPTPFEPTPFASTSESHPPSVADKFLQPSLTYLYAPTEAGTGTSLSNLMNYGDEAEADEDGGSGSAGNREVYDSRHSQLSHLQ